MRTSRWKRNCCVALLAVWAGATSLENPLMAQSAPALTDARSGVALNAQPMTVSLAPRAAMRPALAAARLGGSPVALAVEGIEGSITQPVRINIFIDKPDADRSTPTDDPHFAGTVALLPRQGKLKRTGRIFDLSRAGALTTDAPLRVTLVPVVGTDEKPQTPRDFSLRIGKIYIRHEK